MQDKANEAAMQADIAKLAGSTLNSITVHIFYVDFAFLGDLTVIVRIQKGFNFNFDGSSELKFEPGPSPASNQSTEFVNLLGMECRAARLNATTLEIEFIKGARLIVEFTDQDFEPLHIIGCSGPNGEKWEYFYVL